ncbi:YT521-B-like domain-containing protein [Xylariales sp. PMI_506]|nr:YT521-B-like domain-containing protein [Xylariales sp. PMI_506]
MATTVDSAAKDSRLDQGGDGTMDTVTAFQDSDLSDWLVFTNWHDERYRTSRLAYHRNMLMVQQQELALAAKKAEIREFEREHGVDPFNRFSQMIMRSTETISRPDPDGPYGDDDLPSCANRENATFDYAADAKDDHSSETRYSPILRYSTPHMHYSASLPLDLDYEPCEPTRAASLQPEHLKEDLELPMLPINRPREAYVDRPTREPTRSRSRSRSCSRSQTRNRSRSPPAASAPPAPTRQRESQPPTRRDTDRPRYKNTERNAPRQADTADAPRVAKSINMSPDDDTRFFVIRSFNMGNVKACHRDGTWATRPENAKVLTEAFEGSRNVILFFSVNQSRAFQGYARMACVPSRDVAAPDWYRKISWSISDPFRVEWLLRKTVNDSTVRSLRNKLNDNLPITRSRDCQELDGACGRKLLAELNRQAAKA